MYTKQQNGSGHPNVGARLVNSLALLYTKLNRLRLKLGHLKGELGKPNSCVELRSAISTVLGQRPSPHMPTYDVLNAGPLNRFALAGGQIVGNSGKGVQPQNFTRGEYEPHQLEDLFWLLTHEDADTIELLFERPIDAIAQGMRGFIKAPPGYKFVVSDFAAIEARMLAWLANETNLLEAYRKGYDVYIKQAASLYKVDEQELIHRVKILKDKQAIGWRKFGKDIVLGAGFGMGGVGFYRNCIARGINVEEDFAHKAIKVYRADNKNIVKFWYDMEECAIKAVHEKRTVKNPVVLRNLKFFTDKDWFVIQLPSGRWMRYREPSVRKVERFGKLRAQLTFRTEIKGKWVRESTYGGKLTENVVQAVARDAMVESMVRAWRRGYPSIGTVHDELITEVPVEFGSKHELESIMGTLPKWCRDAPITAEGWAGPRYRK